MQRLLSREAVRLADSVQQALPLMQAMDVPRCLATMKDLGPDKQREWAMRARCPLRLAVGLYQVHPEGIALAFGADAETHTVLCLVADLLARLPQAAVRHTPQTSFGPDPQTLDPMFALHMMHAAVYRAEADQDRAIGWGLWG